MIDSKNLSEARQTSPRLGVATGNGNYLFSEWTRRYPDLSSENYILPCQGAEYICVVVNSTAKVYNAGNLLAQTEDEIARVIIDCVDNTKRRNDNPAYLDSLFKLYKECAFACKRFGVDCTVRYLEEGRKKIHNRRNGYWQDNSKRNK